MCINTAKGVQYVAKCGYHYFLLDYFGVTDPGMALHGISETLEAWLSAAGNSIEFAAILINWCCKI